MNGVRGGLVAGALLALALGAVGCGGDDDGGGDEPLAGSGGTGGGVSGSSGGGSGGTGGTSSTPTGGGTGGSANAGSGGTSATAGSGGTGGSGNAGSGGTGGTGEPDAGPDDGGMDAAEPDPCEDVADACDTEGLTCDGDELVDCAPNDDDCLVETRTDCSAGSTDFCDDSGDPAECAACPATDCTDESATCNDDTLIVCALDGNGCLVETETNCAAGTTDYCDADLTPAACAACAANDCTAAGTSCSGANLVTCTVDADGCFARATMSCIGGSTDACEETSSTVAACVDDECRLPDGTLKDDVCVEDVEAQCVDEVLVECVPDADLCPIAERTDCTVDDPPNNVCDETLATPACAFDPCVGVTDCEDEGITCSGADRVVCAPDANLCLVETVTDCTQGGTVGETCNPGLDPPDCDTCADDPNCVGAAEGDVSCNGDVLSTCTDTDGDDCLEEVLEDCGADFDCTDTDGCVYDGGDVCTETIDEERILRAAGSYGPFDTDGEAHQYGNYVCPGTVQGFPFVAASPDLLFAIDVPANHVLEASFVGVSGFEGSGVWMLQLPGCADAGGTQIESMCRAMSDRSISYANEGDETARIYIAVDADNVSGNPNTGVFSLSVDTRPLGCGDGEADGSEECDDGNTLSGDGCDDCMEEEDYQCTQIDPSVCTRRPADGICGNVECDPLPGGTPAAVDICCTTSAECGVAYAPVYGASCIESMPTRPTDTECDDESAGPLGPLFNAYPMDGCCVQLEGGGSTCGLTAGINLGCVPRTAVWQALLDGPGSALYTGPFLAQPCTP